MASTPQHVVRAVGPWGLQQPIGSGSFAIVWRAHHLTSGKVAAVKEINTDRLSKKLAESLASEISVLQRTSHKNIVGMLDLIKEEGKMYLVLEFCGGGDLGHYLRRYGRVPESTARYLMQQLAEGLKVLRHHSLVHRDLKPQNLLLSDSTRQPVLKIADFGFARNLQPQGLAETLCGSPLYMAPEILQFHRYDAKADLWSVGAILFELLTGKPPYTGANHIQLLQNIEKGEGGRLPDAIAAALSPSCKQLLHQLLRRNPVERIGFEEFFEHPFVAQTQSMPDLPSPARAGSGPGAAAGDLTSPARPTAAQQGQSSGVSQGGGPASGQTGPGTGAGGTGRACTSPDLTVDAATGITARQVVQQPRSPPPRLPTPPAYAASGGAIGVEAADAASPVPARSGQHPLFSGGGPLGPAGEPEGVYGYSDVDLGPSPARTPQPGRRPEQPSSLTSQQQGGWAGAAGSGAGGLAAGGDNEEDEDFVVVSPTSSTGGLAQAVSSGSRSLQASASADVGSSAQATPLPSSSSKSRGGWGALSKMGPALLKPRSAVAAAAAATQQLRDAVAGVAGKSLAQGLTARAASLASAATRGAGGSAAGVGGGPAGSAAGAAAAMPSLTASLPAPGSAAAAAMAAAAAAAAAVAAAGQAAAGIPGLQMQALQVNTGRGAAPLQRGSAPGTPLSHAQEVAALTSSQPTLHLNPQQQAVGAGAGSRTPGAGPGRAGPGGSEGGSAVAASAPGRSAGAMDAAAAALASARAASTQAPAIPGSASRGSRSSGSAAAAAAKAAAPPAPNPALAPEAVAQVVKLPQQLDTVDLLQRVLHILSDMARTRWDSAVASAEAAAEAAAAHMSTMPTPLQPPSPVVGGSPGSAGGAGAGAGEGSAGASQSQAQLQAQAQAQVHSPGLAMFVPPSLSIAATAAAAAELEPAAQELLALYLFCCRLLDAALVGQGVALQGAHAQAAALLTSHARGLLVALGDRLQAAMRRLPPGAPVPRGLDAVFGAALRCAREAAADELMGQSSSSLQGYAKAVDLLLFLMTDVPAVAQAKPRLSPGDEPRVHKLYAAIKIRQSALMHSLNKKMLM